MKPSEFVANVLVIIVGICIASILVAGTLWAVRGLL